MFDSNILTYFYLLLKFLTVLCYFKHPKIYKTKKKMLSAASRSVFVTENRACWQEGRSCKYLWEACQSGRQWSWDLSPLYPADTSASSLPDQQSETHRGFVYWPTTGPAGGGWAGSLQSRSTASQSQDQLHPRTTPTHLQQGYNQNCLVAKIQMLANNTCHTHTHAMHNLIFLFFTICTV